MTTIKNDIADNFVRKPPAETRFYLLHGSDEGLIHERAKALAIVTLGGKMDPLRLTRWAGDVVARDPGALFDEVYALSMFGGQRVVWIDSGGRDLTGCLEPLFARPPADCALIIEAGSLKKGAAMRSLFELSNAAVAVECYTDERRALSALIEAEAREAGLVVTNEAREYLLTLLGSDRLTTRSEVSKLMLYAQGRSIVDIADVEAIVADAAPTRVDALVDLALTGNMAEVEGAISRYFRDGGDAASLLIRLVSRVVSLHQIRLEMENGRSFDAALPPQSARLPAIMRAGLAKQAERWTSASLGKRLPAIQGVVARARRQSDLASAITTRALWAMASSARASRG